MTDHGKAPGLKVLVVEDYEDALLVMRMMLEQRGHRVVKAADGFFQQLLKADVNGYVLKQSASYVLIGAVRAVAAGALTSTRRSPAKSWAASRARARSRTPRCGRS
jgi:PleD family two-component response regulator